MPTENKTIGQLRLDRIIAANEFIRVIANCGRRFFRNSGAGHDAFLTLNARRNIVWLFDDYTGARINVVKEGRWDGFSHGGTLKSLAPCDRWICKQSVTNATDRAPTETTPNAASCARPKRLSGAHARRYEKSNQAPKARN